MNRMKLFFLCGIALLSLFGCYTVVMIPGSVHRTISQDVVVEEEPYEELLEEGTQKVIHEHYLYGDLWPGYVNYEPYWSSSYWWYYPGWSRFSWHWGIRWWDPWWDPWFFDWGYYGYRRWNGYWGGYYGWGYSWDPYWAYWNDYYASSSLKRRPFDRRSVLHRDGEDEGAVTKRMVGGGEESSVRRIRTDSDEGRVTRSTEGSVRRESSELRVRKPASRKESTSGAKTSTRSGSTSSTRRIRSSGSGSSGSGVTTRSSPSSSSSSGSKGSTSSSSGKSSSSGSRRTKK